MKKNLAIVGLAAQFGLYSTLEQISANLYDGSQPWGKFPKKESTSHLLLKLSEQALKDSPLLLKQTQLLKIAIITAQKSTFFEEKNFINLENLVGLPVQNFNLYQENDSLVKALEITQILLSAQEVEAVVIVGVNRVNHLNPNIDKLALSYDTQAQKIPLEEAAIAVVIKDYHQAKENRDRIYAVIEAFTQLSESLITPVEAIRQTSQEALAQAGCQPTDIEYLELAGNGIETQEWETEGVPDEIELKGLIKVYSVPDNPCHCAVGSVKANIGHTRIVAGLASLLKTTLCLYQRYIPKTPNELSPKHPELCKTSSFYIPSESKPWFIASSQRKRKAAINLVSGQGNYGHVILSEEAGGRATTADY